VVLPILVGGGVSTAGVILTIGAMAGAVMLPEAVLKRLTGFLLRFQLRILSQEKVLSLLV
jgi:hypothetical protein